MRFTIRAGCELFRVVRVLGLIVLTVLSFLQEGPMIWRVMMSILGNVGFLGLPCLPLMVWRMEGSLGGEW